MPLVILFAAYAVFVWYLAMRYRRRWQSFAVTVIAVLLVYWLNPILQRIGWLDTGIRLLLWAEMSIIFVTGMFISCLPRPPAHAHCHYCKYDLRGHADVNPDTFVCPECGTPADGYASLRRRHVAQAPLPAGSAPPQPPQRTDQQHQERQQGSQPPAQRAELPG